MRRTIDGQTSSARRPSKARPRVTSSAYSRSPPTGKPLARRGTRSPLGFSTGGGGGAGAAQPHRLDQAGEVGRGRLALQVGVGGNDQLGDISGEARHELADAQVV